MEHEIWGILNLCSQAIVTHTWLQNKLSCRLWGDSSVFMSTHWITDFRKTSRCGFSSPFPNALHTGSVDLRWGHAITTGCLLWLYGPAAGRIRRRPGSLHIIVRPTSRLFKIHPPPLLPPPGEELKSYPSSLADSHGWARAASGARANGSQPGSTQGKNHDICGRIHSEEHQWLPTQRRKGGCVYRNASCRFYNTLDWLSQVSI